MQDVEAAGWITGKKDWHDIAPNIYHRGGGAAWAGGPEGAPFSIRHRARQRGRTLPAPHPPLGALHKAHARRHPHRPVEWCGLMGPEGQRPPLCSWPPLPFSPRSPLCPCVARPPPSPSALTVCALPCLQSPRPSPSQVPRASVWPSRRGGGGGCRARLPPCEMINTPDQRQKVVAIREI